MSPIPELPSLKNLKIFFLGLLWAVVCGSGTAAIVVGDDLYQWSQYDDPIDWKQVRHVACGSLLISVPAYWRKHKALISPPPDQDPDATALRKAAGA